MLDRETLDARSYTTTKVSEEEAFLSLSYFIFRLHAHPWSGFMMVAAVWEHINMIPLGSINSLYAQRIIWSTTLAQSKRKKNGTRVLDGGEGLEK